MAVLLLIAAIVLGLIMIPFGLPGTLVMFAAALCYHLLVPGGGIGVFTVIGVGVLMIVAEALEWMLTARFTRRYGGSRRAGWGALVGGLAGALIGVPVPVIGSVIGGFVGAFAGAALFEYSKARRAGAAAQAGWGAMLGRAAAAAVKMGLGVVIAVVALFAALRG